MDLRAALEMQEVEVVTIEAPVRVAEEEVVRMESGERQEEKSRKNVILTKVCAEAQKAEDVDAFVSLTCIVHETIPSANIIPSRDTYLIVCI